MIEKRKVKFSQIAADNGFVFGLDGTGNIWECRNEGDIRFPVYRWIKIEPPVEEFKTFRPTSFDPTDSTFGGEVK